ncbi:MAG: hypothetical protein LC624_02420 [Halobacteriales archaeon]|nr:hypothetical protein [Halobacteriales archaeon]
MDMGRGPMAGWLRVGPEGFATEPGLRRWVERGASDAASLPAKEAKADERAPKPQKAGRKRR